MVLDPLLFPTTYVQPVQRLSPPLNFIVSVWERPRRPIRRRARFVYGCLYLNCRVCTPLVLGPYPFGRTTTAQRPHLHQTRPRRNARKCFRRRFRSRTVCLYIVYQQLLRVNRAGSAYHPDIPAHKGSADDSGKLTPLFQTQCNNTQAEDTAHW